MTALRLICDSCEKDVSGSKQAVIHVPYKDAMKARTEYDEKIWESVDQRKRGEFPKALNLSELLESLPFEAHWEIHCDECNPHPDDDGGWCDGCYWIGLERCSTTERLLDWTAHLMGKDWFSATDWNDFIYRVLAMSRVDVDA